MGSPVSSIVTNLCMEEIEELAHNQYTPSPKKWFRLVDEDIFSIMRKHKLTKLYNLLNSIEPHLHFIIEQEQDGKLSVLYTFCYT